MDSNLTKIDDDIALLLQFCWCKNSEYMLPKFFLQSVLKSSQFWLILAFLMTSFKSTCISLNVLIVFNVLKLVYIYPANIYLFKVVLKTLKKVVKYIQN